MQLRTLACLIVATVALAHAPSVAAADIGWRGWGPRVGLSEDPDQVFGGAHFDLGEFAPNVRFQPSAEVGLGDDTLSVIGNVMVSYYFPIEGKVTPYAGGSVSAAFYSLDDDCKGFGRRFGEPGDCGDTEVEIGPMAVGGVEMTLSGGTRFLAELQIGFGDLPDARILAGWTF